MGKFEFELALNFKPSDACYSPFLLLISCKSICVVDASCMFVCALTFAWFYLELTLLMKTAVFFSFDGLMKIPSIKWKPSPMGCWATG